MQNATPVILVHTHPVFPFKLFAQIHDQEMAMINEYFNLSGPDRAAALAYSLSNPGLPFMIVALVPAGFKYSALFLDGKDVTAQIEKFLR